MYSFLGSQGFSAARLNGRNVVISAETTGNNIFTVSSVSSHTHVTNTSYHRRGQQPILDRVPRIMARRIVDAWPRNERASSSFADQPLVLFVSALFVLRFTLSPPTSKPSFLPSSLVVLFFSLWHSFFFSPFTDYSKLSPRETERKRERERETNKKKKETYIRDIVELLRAASCKPNVNDSVCASSHRDAQAALGHFTLFTLFSFG